MTMYPNTTCATGGGGGSVSSNATYCTYVTSAQTKQRVENYYSWKGVYTTLPTYTIKSSDYSTGDTVFHDSYGKGKIVEIDKTKEAQYLVKFDNFISHFKTYTYWCTIDRLQQTTFKTFTIKDTKEELCLQI